MESTRPPCFVQERQASRAVQARRFRDGNRPLKRTDAGSRRRAAASDRRLAPNRVEQIKHLLLRDRRGHGDLFGVEVGKRGPETLGARDHAGHAEADVIGALVAEDLGRHAGHRRAFDGRRAVGVHELLREGGEKPAGGRAEADADDVHVHALALDGGRRFRRDGRCFQVAI